MSNRYKHRLNESPEKQTLVDWVNSLDLPSCPYITSFEDFRSGTAMIEIVSWLLSKPIRASQHNRLEDIISNWDNVLRELKPYLDDDLQSISAENIICLLYTSPSPRDS